MLPLQYVPTLLSESSNSNTLFFLSQEQSIYLRGFLVDEFFCWTLLVLCGQVGRFVEAMAPSPKHSGYMENFLLQRKLLPLFLNCGAAKHSQEVISPVKLPLLLKSKDIT
jgi:hypothetical protein